MTHDQKCFYTLAAAAVVSFTAPVEVLFCMFVGSIVVSFVGMYRSYMAGY